jgi:hypothetical protein
LFHPPADDMPTRDQRAGFSVATPPSAAFVIEKKKAPEGALKVFGP